VSSVGSFFSYLRQVFILFRLSSKLQGI